MSLRMLLLITRLTYLFIVMHLGVCNSCFYIANSNTFKVVDINLRFEEGGEQVIEPTEENGQVATY